MFDGYDCHCAESQVNHFVMLSLKYTDLDALNDC